MMIDLFYQLLKVNFFFDEIDLVGIDNQERCFRIIKEEVISLWSEAKHLEVNFPITLKVFKM